MSGLMEEFFKEMVVKKEEAEANEDNAEAVCMLKDHPDLKGEHETYEAKCKVWSRIRDEHIEDGKKMLRAYFHDLEAKLVEKEIVTAEQRKAKPGVRIKDGVIYIYDALGRKRV